MNGFSAKTVLSPRERVNRQIAKRLLLAQCAVALLLSALALLKGTGHALATLTGAGIAIIANSYFAWRALRPIGVQAPRNISNNFYRAMLGKYLIVLTLFAVVFRFQSAWAESDKAMFLLLAFVVTHGLVALGPALENKMFSQAKE